jgi:hypothetical protein
MALVFGIGIAIVDGDDEQAAAPAPSRKPPSRLGGGQIRRSRSCEEMDIRAPVELEFRL